MERTSTFGHGFLALGNVVMALMWLRVFLFLFGVVAFDGAHGWHALTDPYSPDLCEDELRPRIIGALAVSAIEVVNAVVGLTKAKPHQAILFTTFRAGVEFLVAPLFPCGAWQHLYTALCWCVGEFVRFACFSLDVIVDSPQVTQHVKSIRYTVGPIMFPLGALGEMLMFARAAADGRPALYLVVALWPFGFYPLYMQLLSQRRKHFKPKEDVESHIKFV